MTKEIHAIQETLKQQNTQLEKTADVLSQRGIQTGIFCNI